MHIADNTEESLNNPHDQTMDVQGILDLAWAADDAGFDGFEAYLVTAREQALEVWSKVTREASGRQKRQKRAEERGRACRGERQSMPQTRDRRATCMSATAERDKWWHCDFCGDHGLAEDPYVNGDTEPCIACGEGVSRVMTLKDAARLESAIAQGLVQPRRAYSERNESESDK